MEETVVKVLEWAMHKGILEEEFVPKQCMKVMEEFGETCSAILKGKEEEVIDGLGDSFVTLIILCGQLGLKPSECLDAAYNEIKDRTGKTVDGTFIKN
jgi:phosphoribosyl-ATP pyrophosphohydrolase